MIVLSSTVMIARPRNLLEHRRVQWFHKPRIDHADVRRALHRLECVLETLACPENHDVIAGD